MTLPDWLTGVDWLYVSAILIMTIAALAGIVLTVITLPGTWVMLAIALGLKLWQPELLSWWVLVAALLLATIGEIIEFFASALGATKGGATKKGAIAACVGSIIGAVVGAPFFFPLGSIVGGVVGAGAGALLGERAMAKKEWGEAARAGAGAAAGRFIATLAKTGIATGMALILAIAVCIP